MSLEDMYRKRVAANKKAAKAKKATPEATAPKNLGTQFTNLSRMYDNNGNPHPEEPTGYTTSGGH